MEKNTTVEPVVSEIKSIPIFVGCDKKDIVLGIEKHINETLNADESQTSKYVLAVMSEEIYNKSLENWFLGTLSADERERMKQYQTDKALEIQAMTQAMAMETKLPKDCWPLMPARLKAHFERYMGRKLSNAQIDEFIGFMLTYGYMINTTPNNKHYESLYALSIKNEDRIKSYETSRNKLIEEKAALDNQIKIFDKEIDKLTVATIIDKESTGQPIKKEPKLVDFAVDKQGNDFSIHPVNEDGDLNVTTEHLNDRH